MTLAVRLCTGLLVGTAKYPDAFIFAEICSTPKQVFCRHIIIIICAGPTLTHTHAYWPSFFATIELVVNTFYVTRCVSCIMLCVFPQCINICLEPKQNATTEMNSMGGIHPTLQPYWYAYFWWFVKSLSLQLQIIWQMRLHSTFIVYICRQTRSSFLLKINVCLIFGVLFCILFKQNNFVTL